MRLLKLCFLLGLVLVSFTGCQKTTKTTNSVETSLVTRGRTVYQSNCTACHHPNPHLPGSIGPEVFGSSRALLEARILRGDYPPDYKAKRMTHVMNALPQLKDEIDAIHAYLNQN